MVTDGTAFPVHSRTVIREPLVFEVAPADAGRRLDVILANAGTYGTNDPMSFVVTRKPTGDSLSIATTNHAKCGRCWRHQPEVKEEGDLCDRCAEVLK